MIANNPGVRTLAVENITDKCLTLGFSTSMPGELGIYQLRDDSLSDIGDDTDSLFSEGSEEDGHESRRRLLIYSELGLHSFMAICSFELQLLTCCLLVTSMKGSFGLMIG